MMRRKKTQTLRTPKWRRRKKTQTLRTPKRRRSTR
jgi:hypothetical protein